LAVILGLVGIGLLAMPQGDAAAAPLAMPTPVSVSRPAGANDFITFDLFNASAIAADTTSTCVDVGQYGLVDVQYTIDQGTVNTTTLTTKWSVDGGTLISGVNLVASNAADASDMQQAQIFGRYFCILADVTNTNAVTITAKAIAK
jgi:hypothetical protein